MEEKLSKLYNDPDSHAAYAGVERLWQAAKKKLGRKVKKKDVQHYLEGHRTYTLMRPRRIHYPRSKTIAAGYLTDVQVDLADMQALSRHNKGFRYILVAIDVLSKQVYVVAVRSKKAEDMVDAFKQLIEKLPMKMHRIFSDKGLEFKNAPLKKFFEDEDIEKYESTHSSVKASICERCIRNIKNRLYRYFAQKHTLNWIDIIEKIVDGINHSKSRAHGMLPADINFSNAQKVWEKMYGNYLYGKKQRIKPKFKKGDFIRMSHAKGQFEKGYIPNYSDEILEIDKVKRHTRPVLYKVKDEHGEKFKGSFYGEELTKVRKEADTTYRIEKVLKKRTLPDGKKELLVKYIGYPETHWIKESDLV